MKTRTTYSADFKAKLALEVIKGNRTLAEIASDAQVHPNLLTQWKWSSVESKECELRVYRLAGTLISS